MNDLLTKLYSYEYFGIYLIISIVVLVILFIIVLFFGKKDQKIREVEATKKLQQINEEDAFKEDSIVSDVSVQNIEDALNDTIIVPNINTFANEDEGLKEEIPEPVLPVNNIVDTNLNANYEASVEPLTNPFDQIEIKTEQPVLNKVEEKPLIFQEYNFEPQIPAELNEVNEEIKEPVIEPVEEEEKEISTSFINDAIKDSNKETEVEEIKEVEEKAKAPEIFSSVYVPEKDEVKSNDNELEFELPMLKKDSHEEKEEIVNEEVKDENKDEEIIIPELTDYNLDNLSGEIYDIK